MRLLNVDTFKLQDYLDDTAPPYVIASHRWLEGEVTFQDVRDGTNTDAPGYKKVEAFARYVREHVSGIKWLWIDTCCINKDGAAELSESINCMFRWYRDAALCVAFLSDVEGVDGLVEFDRSTWFKRGWTLQELLAPYLVLFVNSSWEVIGHKGSATQEFLGVVGPDLAARICSATGISEAVLLDYDECGSVSVHERMRWIEGRKTTRPEDMVYALYGLLGVTLGANYGEDCEGAKQRLLVALRERIEAFDRMKAWLLPPDPWTTHQAARQLYESGTGIWLLSDEKYLAWKEGATRCLWLHGKAGSGKTTGTITANDNQLIRDNVDEEDRGDPWDSLALLSGLIVEDAGVRFGKSDADFNDRIGEAAERTISQQEQRTGRRRMRGVSSSGGPIGWYEPRYESPGGGREGGPFLRLAHYSVKEYLESKRILTSAAKGFALATASGHRFIAQSSLVYLSHIVQGMQRVSAIERNILPTFNRLPLAEYVVCNWHEHARKQHWVGTRREVAFLSVRQNSSFWIGAKNYADCANLGSPETYDSDRTALQCAVIAGLIPVIDALLLAGADVYERAGYWGMNVLELASISGQVEVVAFLLRARPDLQERRMSRGLNALELAAESGHFEVVKALIRAGADSKERSACGDHTALSLASAEGHLEIVQALLQAGASVNDWDRGYMNARERASAKGHARIVEALLQAGALGNQSSRIFIAALYAAREGGYFKVEELLERAYWSRPGGCWTADHRSIGTQTD
nr:hypothetical protein B0A51_00185 [Rachicladosporium sp. CCFEE 5018]